MRSDKRGRPSPQGTNGPRGSKAPKVTFWARVYLAVHLILVLIPIAIVAT